MKTKPTLDDCVFLCLSDGKWWTFWGIQGKVKMMEDRFFGEPSISAAIRNLRKYHCRKKYRLPMSGEVIVKRRRPVGSGYEYKLIGVNNERSN